MQQITKQNTELNQVEYGLFSLFLNHYIKKAESGKILTKKGKKFSESTLRGYEMLKKWYGEFIIFMEKENPENEDVNFDLPIYQINYSFGENFYVYLVNETNLTKNSIAIIIDKFKAIMNYAFKKGVAYWNGAGLIAPTEKSTQTYLSKEEINNLRIDTLTPSENKILDIQIIQSFTGLRISTLKKFLSSPTAYIKEYDGHSYIDIIEKKTEQQSTVPFGNIVADILRKHGGSIIVPSEQYINRVLKSIAQKAGLENSIVDRKTIKGETIERLIPKSQKISTHTNRRTLISLMTEAKFHSSEIMPISGHSTEKQMLNYVKLENVTKISGILGDDFFNKII
ncbi:phage integrase SAM-like domain-containing protein [uncultured Chryseobacterium sp.]|uniref:tyrosine-type recombinase/integrase n=1 Tax=uncultured Chryseobacterium sp. TaxID=259322 RepID=UPI0025F9FA16|nr:phage integrase SAM-like domain-containing protein [uncultured Chryseobacterium sp.]